MLILRILELLKPIKTDRKSIVVSGSLDITSGSLLKWPFMPKQGPICLIHDPIHGYPLVWCKLGGVLPVPCQALLVSRFSASGSVLPDSGVIWV